MGVKRTLCGRQPRSPFDPTRTSGRSSEAYCDGEGVRSGDQIFAMLMPDEHARDEVSSKVDMVRLDRESARPQVVFTFFSICCPHLPSAHVQAVTVLDV